MIQIHNLLHEDEFETRLNLCSSCAIEGGCRLSSACPSIKWVPKQQPSQLHSANILVFTDFRMNPFSFASHVFAVLDYTSFFPPSTQC